MGVRTDWPIDWLIAWLVALLTDRLFDWLTDWLDDWLAERLIDCLIHPFIQFIWPSPRSLSKLPLATISTIHNDTEILLTNQDCVIPPIERTLIKFEISWHRWLNHVTRSCKWPGQQVNYVQRQDGSKALEKMAVSQFNLLSRFYTENHGNPANKIRGAYALIEQFNEFQVYYLFEAVVHAWFVS